MQRVRLRDIRKPATDRQGRERVRRSGRRLLLVRNLLELRFETLRETRLDGAREGPVLLTSVDESAGVLRRDGGCLGTVGILSLPARLANEARKKNQVAR